MTSTSNQTNTNDEDWQRFKSLKDRMSTLCGSEIFADVVFLAGKQETKIPAHKLLLCVASPVFAMMFDGETSKNLQKETTHLRGKEVECVRVPDISSEAMRSMLLYVYTEKVELEMAYVFEVLYAANKYLLYGLKNECVAFLDTKIDPSNVCFVLSQSLLYENKSLTQKCTNMIENCANQIVKSPSFHELDISTLLCILQMDKLDIDEWALFQEVLNWASAECTRKDVPINRETIREALGPAIYAIRFPTMQQKDFATYALREDCILTERERLDIFLSYNLGAHKSIDSPFSTDPRRPSANSAKDEIVVKRFLSTTTWQCNLSSGFKHYLGFSISGYSGELWLTGFAFYGTQAATQAVTIKIYIETVDRGIRLIKSRAIINLPSLYAEDSFHRLNFDEPVLVTSNTSYAITTEILTELPGTQSFHVGYLQNGKNEYGTDNRKFIVNSLTSNSVQLIPYLYFRYNRTT